MDEPQPTPRLARVYVEAVGGVAGDMLLAALLDLGGDLEAVRAAIRSMGERGLTIEVSHTTVDGERACRVKSLPRGHGHHGRHLEDVMAIVDGAAITPAARAHAGRIFDVLAEAEARSHGSDPHHVHLHEVGELDSILDVVGIAVAYDSLGNPPLAAGPLPSGHGTVESAHGTLTLPAPATRHIAVAAGIPLVEVPVDGETVTPTGIAALAALGTAQGQPLGRRGDVVGVGAGTRRFPGRPNVVRVHGYRA